MLHDWHWPFFCCTLIAETSVGFNYVLYSTVIAFGESSEWLVFPIVDPPLELVEASLAKVVEWRCLYFLSQFRHGVVFELELVLVALSLLFIVSFLCRHS